jgi:hypothetical protein
MTKTTAQTEAARRRKIRSVRGVVASYLHEISTSPRRESTLAPAPTVTEPAKA